MPLNDLELQLQELYAPCCDLSHDDLSDPGKGDLPKYLAEMVASIWKEKGFKEGTINRDVTTEFANRLFSGVEKGYGKKIAALNYNTPDWHKLASLQKNVWHFSAAKNYTQLRQLSNALIGEDGKLRSYSKFKEEAFKINNTHINQHLKAEYQLAVSGAQMAAKWVHIQETKDVLPLLEFDAVMDERTSQICSGLNGTVLPVDHPFWQIYYPPNHFLCRSTANQLRAGELTLNPPNADIPKMFQINLGEKGLIYPPGHSYYVDLPEGVENQGMAAMRKELYKTAKHQLKDKTVNVKGVGEVSFTNKGIKEMLNQNHDDIILKNQLVPFANQLLKHSHLVHESPNDLNKELKFFYLKVDGLKNFFLNVKQTEQGELVLYSITDKYLK